MRQKTWGGGKKSLTSRVNYILQMGNGLFNCTALQPVGLLIARCLFKLDSLCVLIVPFFLAPAPSLSRLSSHFSPPPSPIVQRGHVSEAAMGCSGCLGVLGDLSREPSR